MIDILYIAKDRHEFTLESLQALLTSTNWHLVSRFVLYDDGSAEETRSLLVSAGAVVSSRYENVSAEIFDTSLGAPVAIMNDFLNRPGSSLFAKIDNDAMMPPDWLDIVLPVMQEHKELGVLGLEPPASRTPAPWATLRRVQAPELIGPFCYSDKNHVHLGSHGYAKCQNVGGLAIIRRSIFKEERMLPHSIYGGFGEWQNAHPDIVCGWLVPPIKVFVLDRLPMSPWRELSDEYIRKGMQRGWTTYTGADQALWDWWKS